MPGCKTVAFTRRIIAFNETFAPLGSKITLKNKGSAYAITWHEGITKRKGEDIASAFIKWLSLYGIREKTNVTLCLDNCTAQGKNWIIFTALVAFVNSTCSCIETITLRYFEKGHTFMSADTYQHLVEKAMKEMSHVYDFPDWISALNQHGRAVNLNFADIYNFRKGLSSGKRAANKSKISEIVEVLFKRGSTRLFWKTDFDKDFREAEFLQTNLVKLIQKGIWPMFDVKYTNGPKEVGKLKKESIIANLCPLMPSESRRFWKDLENRTFLTMMILIIKL